jgi:pimeloyl-ACP methyl ester carboxylesterase
MPQPKPKSQAKPTPAKRPPFGPILPPSQTEDVSPLWLLKALGAMLIVALLCGYLTFCFLFYQGQWQIPLHPARTTSPLVLSIPSEFIHFGPDESAIPQLTGLWIPAAPNTRYSATTLLYLRDGDGSLADSSAALTTLHALGINIFAFDYRGYGQSADTHPNQIKLDHDAATAYQYLTTSRHLAASTIVPYGVGTGASLATHLATNHPEITALLLDNPRADLLSLALKDPRVALLPVRLLFHDRFPLAEPLASLKTPKLLLSSATNGAIPEPYRKAASPKITVELSTSSDPNYLPTIARFLDQYVQQPLVPSTTPTH